MARRHAQHNRDAVIIPFGSEEYLKRRERHSDRQELRRAIRNGFGASALGDEEDEVLLSGETPDLSPAMAV